MDKKTTLALAAKLKAESVELLRDRDAKLQLPTWFIRCIRNTVPLLPRSPFWTMVPLRSNYDITNRISDGHIATSISVRHSTFQMSKSTFAAHAAIDNLSEADTIELDNAQLKALLLLIETFVELECDTLQQPSIRKRHAKKVELN